jgi:2-phosphoglycerate kinase
MNLQNNLIFLNKNHMSNYKEKEFNDQQKYNEVIKNLNNYEIQKLIVNLMPCVKKIDDYVIKNANNQSIMFIDNEKINCKTHFVFKSALEHVIQTDRYAKIGVNVEENDPFEWW